MLQYYHVANQYHKSIYFQINASKNKLRFQIYTTGKNVLNDLNMIGLEDALYILMTHAAFTEYLMLDNKLRCSHSGFLCL